MPLDFLLVTPKVEDIWETGEKLIWQNKTLWIVFLTGLIKIEKLAGNANDLIAVDRSEKHLFQIPERYLVKWFETNKFKVKK